MMRIKLLSDLHLDHAGMAPIDQDDCDVIIIAGDIAEDLNLVDEFLSQFQDRISGVNVIYVPGNHEFCGGNYQVRNRELDDICLQNDVIMLQNYHVIIDGVMLVGSTLWTDFMLDGQDRQKRNMEWAERNIRDLRAIKYGNDTFTAKDMLKEHKKAVEYINFALNIPEVDKRVVITHFAPHQGSVHPRYQHMMNAYWCSDQEGLLSKADLWLHGHVHDSFDYDAFGCRVVCNPRGYSSQYDLAMENALFDKNLIIDLDTSCLNLY